MIARIQREHEAKIAMVSSIARSQQALASILESIAEVTAHSETTAHTLAENIRLLVGYQSVMAEMLTGIPLNRYKLGSPASPWITSECQLSNNEAGLEATN
ncbi:hypothetical protein [Paenibacillus sp. EZ-K15]|uniref:hypothetical protein n=1 Tax=Paenibacillus sp. EZ-K15 TaxID=2044275 RepID=UPI000BF4B3A0|nr:hypothetical protein [Paenibacillus sp. EZ-K15]